MIYIYIYSDGEDSMMANIHLGSLRLENIVESCNLSMSGCFRLYPLWISVNLGLNSFLRTLQIFTVRCGRLPCHYYRYAGKIVNTYRVWG